MPAVLKVYSIDFHLDDLIFSFFAIFEDLLILDDIVVDGKGNPKASPQG
jgi:hypothetical protein